MANILTLIAALLAAALASGAALAQQGPYPSRPVRLVVGFAPGGAADFVARSLQEPLSRALGQPIVVENRPGAGSSIAAEHVAKSPADGYTVAIASPSSILVNPILSPKPGFEPRRDLVPVSKVSTSPLVVAVNPGVGVKATPPSVLPRVQAGRLKALAVTSRHRTALVPNVPGMAEAGLPDYEISFWYGFFVPAGTPDEVLKRLFAATRQALEQPKLAELLAREGTEAAGSRSPEEFAQFVAAEQLLWARLVKESGAKPE